MAVMLSLTGRGWLNLLGGLMPNENYFVIRKLHDRALLFSLSDTFLMQFLGLSYLFQLRVGLSRLNFHKFKHNFGDTVNLMCPTNDEIEDTEHFLLLCPSFDILLSHQLRHYVVT